MFGLNVADKYAWAVNKNSGLGGYSWLSSADHFLIMHLSSVILQNYYDFQHHQMVCSTDYRRPGNRLHCMSENQLPNF